MRLLDGDGLAGVGLPLGGEGVVEVLVEFAGRVIGDIEQRGVGEREAECAELHRAGDQYAEEPRESAGRVMNTSVVVPITLPIL